MTGGLMIAVREEDFNSMMQKLDELSKKVSNLSIDDKPMSVKQTAEFLECSTRDIYRKIQYEPAFPVHKYGSTYRFFKSELIEWLREQ